MLLRLLTILVLGTMLTGVYATDTMAPDSGPYPSNPGADVVFQVFFGPPEAIDTLLFVARARAGVIRPVLPLRAIDIVLKRFAENPSITSTQLIEHIPGDIPSSSLEINNPLFVGTIAVAASPTGNIIRCSGYVPSEPSRVLKNVVIRPQSALLLSAGASDKTENVGLLLIINR